MLIMLIFWGKTVDFTNFKSCLAFILWQIGNQNMLIKLMDTILDEVGIFQKSNKTVKTQN